MDQARADYWGALREGDRAGALAAVKRIRDAGRTHLEIIDEVIVPAQERLAQCWFSGEWTLEQEQAATSINEGLVHWLCSFAPAPPADRPLVVVATPDRQELPALVLAEGLAASGYRTTFVGGAAVGTDLLRQVLTRKPRALLVTAGRTSSLAALKPLLENVRATGIPVLAGGPAFGGDPARATAVGATAYAASVAEVVVLLEQLPRRLPTRAPEPASPAEVEAAWLAEFRHEITPYVLRALAARHPFAVRPAWWAELEEHVEHVLGCLASSLVTGDETIMVEVRDWLTQVLAARGADAVLVQDLWELLAVPLRGHPLARVHLAGSAPVGGTTDGGFTDGLATSV
ncbi:B12-binding domain-containing protein [Nocardioides sp. Arc9.136]|uniref:cobalamin B12-binding domain-containing protein n=1 Tax=Nocardioides sp. Arc9.136 TaxID=2996826 RepID=UPI0026655C6F|nr:B12-binding domain-containing protein [Nocardioides sp. Arc9.136]WKN47814.1 B12-binding domain-containing protein [Nocardioides sp. Arc9.136]